MSGPQFTRNSERCPAAAGLDDLPLRDGVRGVQRPGRQHRAVGGRPGGARLLETQRGHHQLSLLQQEV